MATATKPKQKAKSKSKRSTSRPVVTVVFSTFDLGKKADIYRTIRNESIQEWTPIGFKDYQPWGSTPLRDATAQFITHLDSLKKPGTVVIGCLADESGSMNGNTKSVIDGVNEFIGGMSDVEVDPDTDGKVLAVILTDGYENASREVSQSQLANMISVREQEDWTFIYLGANQDAWGVGKETGLSGGVRGQTVNFNSTPEGTQSGIRYAGAMASSYLSSNATYDSDIKNLSQASVNEDGSILDSSGNEYKNIQEAIDKAKENTESTK